jgi:hypothetical protein
MTPAHPTLTSLFIAAYWDLNRVLRTLWRPTLIAFLILLACVAATFIIPAILTHNVIGRLLLKQAISIGGAFLLAPYFIAVLRFVLLDEIARNYTIEADRSRFQLFFGWVVVLVLISSLPSFVVAATMPADPLYYLGGSPSANLSQRLIVGAIEIGIVLVALRMVILLPAIAVDAPGTTWQNALYDTRECMWLVMAASVLPSIPVLLLGAALTPIIGLLPGLLFRVISGVLVVAGIGFIALTLVLVIAARLYQAFGDRLKRAP